MKWVFWIFCGALIALLIEASAFYGLTSIGMNPWLAVAVSSTIFAIASALVRGLTHPDEKDMRGMVAVAFLFPGEVLPGILDKSNAEIANDWTDASSFLASSFFYVIAFYIAAFHMGWERSVAISLVVLLLQLFVAWILPRTKGRPVRYRG